MIAKSPPIDLRCDEPREIRDRIVGRADYLAPTDAELVRAVFERQLQVREVARLMGWREQTVRKRLRRLLSRITSPRFAFVAGSLDAWPPTRRRVAVACILHGRPIRPVAHELGLTLHTVRRHVNDVIALCAERAP
jgi:DNA-directed RNA polymerase specialized sigma24 family protein